MASVSLGRPIASTSFIGGLGPNLREKMRPG